jgi:hypothetical protein
MIITYKSWKDADTTTNMSMAAIPQPDCARNCAKSAKAFRPSHHILGDRRLPDINSELEDLAMDTWRAPQRVSFAHLPDQVTDLASRSRPSRPWTPPPVKPETRAMPLDHGRRFDQHHDFQTAQPYPIEPDPEQAVQRCKLWTTGPLAPQNRQLVT